MTAAIDAAVGFTATLTLVNFIFLTVLLKRSE